MITLNQIYKQSDEKSETDEYQDGEYKDRIAE